ncbi:MAG: hypothetical protein ACRC35_13010 [Angustibacter sp.]
MSVADDRTLFSGAVADALIRLAEAPGVPKAIAAARDACTRLRWHPGLRRRTEQALAETTTRAAQASAAMEGARLPVSVVRDVLRGACPAPDDATGRVVSGALRATVLAGKVGAVLRRTPAQGLATVHVAAATGLIPGDELGRPRRAGQAPRDLRGAAPHGAALSARLDTLYAVLRCPDEVPALVVAAVAWGEIATTRPFTAGTGVVARAVHRAVLVDRGVDPTGVAAPEMACTASHLEHGRILSRYAGGTHDDAAEWVRYCTELVTQGAVEGERVAAAVLAGRLNPGPDPG